MTMGIHEICLSGTCCFCRQAIELRGMSGVGPGPRWDGGWRARPEPGDRPAGSWCCVARMDLARARFRTATGDRHQPDRASIRLLSAPDDPALAADGIGLTRYAVMQKAPVSLFWPAGLLITGVPAGVEPEEVEAELEAARCVCVLRGTVGAFIAEVEVGLRHEIIAGTERSFAEIREDQVRVIDWERLAAAAQGRCALIRHDWQDLRTGGLQGLARKARVYRTASADRKRRIRLLQLRLRMPVPVSPPGSHPAGRMSATS